MHESALCWDSLRKLNAIDSPISAPFYTEDEELPNQYANFCSGSLLFTKKYQVSSKTGSNMHRLKTFRMPYVCYVLVYTYIDTMYSTVLCVMCTHFTYNITYELFWYMCFSIPCNLFFQNTMKCWTFKFHSCFRCIRIWNTLNGECLKAIDTGSQVCNLLWSRHSQELVCLKLLTWGRRVLYSNYW